MLGMQTPVFYGIMPAKFQAIEIRAEDGAAPASPDALSHRVHPLGTPIVLGKTTIDAFEVFHPAPCLAYRFEHGGKTFVFCTDHELRHGTDEQHPRQRQSLAAEARVREFCADVDLLYRDGQYLRVEYDGIKGISNSGAVPRLDWGHSCMEDVRQMANKCGVKRTLIGHNDPNREWAELNWIDETLGRAPGSARGTVELARAETVVNL
jgi:ribonuclease BN (tRNA processing enzyme)